jgi:hypothetical protein
MEATEKHTVLPSLLIIPSQKAQAVDFCDLLRRAPKLTKKAQIQSLQKGATNSSRIGETLTAETTQSAEDGRIVNEFVCQTLTRFGFGLVTSAL